MASPSSQAISTHSRTTSSTLSDDSSLYELSFDYTHDEDGNFVRISKNRQLSAPPTPATTPPPTSYLPEHENLAVQADRLQIPRRSSLSRSESAYSNESLGWESGREWKRTVSTPAQSMGFTRPLAIQKTLSAGYHDKENDHNLGSIAPLQTPVDKYTISRRQAPLPLRVLRSNPPITPNSLPLISSYVPPPSIRISSASSVPAPRKPVHQSDLSLVQEDGGEFLLDRPTPVELHSELEEEAQVALPPSPPTLLDTAYSRPRGSSLSAVNGFSNTSRSKRPPSDGSAGEISTPEDYPSYYSRSSTSSEADNVPPIPPRAPARSRSQGPASSLPLSNTAISRAGRARRVPIGEQKYSEVEYLKESEGDFPVADVVSSDNSPEPRGRHQRRDSETIVPAVQISQASAPSALKSSPTQEPSQSRHRRSPTAPDAPTSSSVLGGTKEKLLSAKTWGAPIGEDDDDRVENGRDEKREAEKDKSSMGNGITSVTSAGFGPGTRQFVVNRKSYIRLDLLGRGGSSRVYRVLTPNNELYALKRISLDKASEEEIAGYRNEIGLLRRLEGNERIIRLIDAEVRGGSKGSLMLVMECGEIDLAHLLQRQQTRAVNMVWIRYYWQQMLEAVHIIHEEKIVHSDLKPANFVLVKGELKLIDFGIANAIANDTTNIQRDHQIGTVNYMSPEAIELPDGMRRLKVGRSSDVWSLGCILYQMVYGQPPFAALSTLGKMKAIPDSAHAIEFPSETAPFLPASSSDSPGNRARDWNEKCIVSDLVLDTLRSCLHRNPKERSTIPALLSSPWLVEKSPALRFNQATIDGHLMSQALQYAIRHGKDDPQWLRLQGEKLVAELQRLARPS